MGIENRAEHRSDDVVPAPGRGEDDLRGIAAAVSGALFRWSVADVVAPDQAMACERGPRAGGVFRPGASCRRTMCVGLHGYDRAGDWRAVCTHAVPLRADVLELGDGTVFRSESYASLSERLQNALWELGGVPLLLRPSETRLVTQGK